jgi:hypothetical protein
MSKYKLKTLTTILLLFTIKSVHAQNMVEINQSLTLQQQEKINSALMAMEAVQKAGAYIESISDLLQNQEITLPVGIKKGGYELIIQKISQNKKTNRPQIFATSAFKFKDTGQIIAFEGSVDIEGKKGLGTSGSLELIAPVQRGLGKEVAVVFKEGTKVKFGCDGIESYHAEIDLFVVSEKIIATDKNGVPTGKKVSTSFNSDFYDFEDFTVSFSFNQYFTFKGLKDIVFFVRGASLDQSELYTSPMVKFPENYFTGSAPDEYSLWKGIAVTEAVIALPAIFTKPSANVDSVPGNGDSTIISNPDRIELVLKDAIIDNNGFSGNVAAYSIIDSRNLDPSKWDMSVSDFILELSKNRVSEFGFGGDINLPPLGKNSLLPYLAIFNPGIGEYEFQVNIKGDYDFPVLKSKLTLNETSTLEIMFKDAGIYPKLNANGLISINAPVSDKDTTKKFSVPDITFENMVISRDEPYFEIGSIGVTGDLVSPEVAGFQLSVTDIQPFDNESGSGLSFDAGVSLTDIFSGEAGINLYGDYNHWKFRHVKVDKVKVEYNSKAFSVAGGVYLKNGDEIYGTGFRGELDFKLIDKFSLDAVGIFGKKDNYRYFLTDVFFETSPPTGILIPPALSFYGFGGGLYRRMQQSGRTDIDTEFGKSLSGICYVPDDNVGMGFMAATKFGLVASPKGFNAKVGFEMQFNKYGGLNFIQLRGDASFMDDPEKWGKMADNINDKVKKLEKDGSKLKLTAKSDLSVPENIKSGFLTASLNIKYDLANKVFAADLSTYLNAGFVQGVGQNGRMGWASAYFSPDKWYTYIGTPDDRLGVELLGLARADGYFMIGDDIPELPLPPKKVLKNFSQDKRDQLSSRTIGELSSGSGIAFGASLGVQFDATVIPFYAHLGVGMGAEFLLKNYGDSAYCLGNSPPLGINGWYARAQAWAWVEADIGMEATVFSKSYRLSILDFTASALLAGAGPNPFYFTGAVGGQFSVLGGLVSGQCDFDFELGEECKVTGGSQFGQDIIAQLTPSDGEKDVNVFASPQAVFNFPVNKEIIIEESDGRKVAYRISLETFSVYYKDNKTPIEGAIEVSSDGRLCLLDPSEPFESQKDMVVRAKVRFEQKKNDQWVVVKAENGAPLFEEKEVAFVSGERPKEILPEHVKYSYPVAMQYNFYPGEHENGYMLVSENYAYLFTTDKPEGYSQVLQLSDYDGNATKSGFSFQSYPAGNDIRLEISFLLKETEFKNDEIYKMAIVNVPIKDSINISDNIQTTETNLEGNEGVVLTTQSAEGTLDKLETKEIYAWKFRTSSHNSFEEKMAAVKNYEGVVWQEYPHVYKLGSNIYDGSDLKEVFDFAEDNSLLPDEKLVQIVPLYDETAWYNKKVAPLIYGNTEMLESAEMESLKAPVHPEVVELSLRTENIKLTKAIIESNTRPTISSLGAIHYNASYYIDKDFVQLRNELANNLIDMDNSNKGTAKFLAANNIPDLNDGDYEIRLDYTLPGKNIVTSSVKRTINLDGFID